MKRASWAPERIDATGLDHALLADSFDDVANANDWFGGTRSLRRSLRPFLNRGVTSILDVGTGSGSTLSRLRARLHRQGHTTRAVGIDNHPDALAVARMRAPDLPLVRADMRALPFRDRAFDIVIATLVLHHLPDALQVDALREMARVARRAVLVSELERARLHWLGARLLAATVWRGNPLTRHDAPVSVRRGYTPAELDTLAARAGLDGRTRRHLLFRLVTTIRPPESDP